jgi:hypothetical protein
MAFEALGPVPGPCHVKSAVWKPTVDAATGVTQWKTEAAPLKKVADFKPDTLKDFGYDDWVSVKIFPRRRRRKSGCAITRCSFGICS